MTTEVRKLETDDIRAIFESLHDNKPPPPGLKFQIVPVDSDGLKLSPPSHEYEDGIYVLLRPDKSKTKKKKSGSCAVEKKPMIPSHLAHLKMKTPLTKNCPWSLSGPQFPKPTAIQQRYCYPQGNEKYASKKGGSMWTMFDREGEEDHEYRLLHVYYSVKRANNLSSASGNSKASSTSAKSKAQKRSKRKKATVNIGKGAKKQKRPLSKSDRFSMHPGSLPPPSPCATTGQIFRRSYINISPQTAASTSSGCIEQDLTKPGSFGGSFEGNKIYSVPSNLYKDEYLPFESNQTLQYCTSEHVFPENGSSQEPHVHSPPDLARDFDTMLGVPLADPSSMLKEPGMEWSVLTDSLDTKDTHPCHRQSNDRYLEALARKLSAVHREIIHEWINRRPRSERGRLVSTVANWARSVSQSPLDLPNPEGDQKQRGFPTQRDGKNASSKMEDWDMAVAV